MKFTVDYEEKLNISVNKAFDLTLRWLKSQHKTKIKQISPSTFIEATQGTMMTSTGHDPNWKKRIRISFYNLEGEQTLIRVEAIPLARTVFRVEKLKQSWFDGLFTKLFSLLHNYGQEAKPESNLQLTTRFCDFCKEKIDNTTKYCPFCGIKID
ncbi:MAG: hypothetical protein ACFE9T_12475 [Promethearchaeota archaeon]